MGLAGCRIHFSNSVAEANEAAWNKIGESKYEIVSTYGSFHGRTLFTVSVGGQAKYLDGFRPAHRGITHVAFNDIEALEGAVNEHTCAVMLEPVQGEGGIRPADKAFLQADKQLCDKYDALLIFDEIQIGVGRSGMLLACMTYDVVQAGVNSEGLPISIEFLGRPFSEAVLFRLGYAYEQATNHRIVPTLTPPLQGEHIQVP